MRAWAAVTGLAPWTRPLAAAVYDAFPDPPEPAVLAAYLRASPVLLAAVADAERTGGPLPAPTPRSLLRADAAPVWPVPRWSTVPELAAHLGLTAGELAWFADVQGREARATRRLRHYRYTGVPKSSGGVRLVEAPKWQLRELQRRILHEVLDAIPPHEAAHGFRPGRSALTAAAPHAGQRAVLRLDLESFFAAVTADRVGGLFRTAGYSADVATVLTGLVTNVVPATVRRLVLTGDDPPDRRLRAWLGAPHLPQGAPTSPALANLVAYRLDRRLSGLAASTGAAYTRYADDLVFSGAAPVLRRAPSLLALATRIATEEGFRVNPAKTSVCSSGGRQRVTGLVVNAHPNVPRREFDLLKATLTNTARHGPQAQNRRGHADFRAHLAGRVAWVEQVNPARGARLRRIYDSIDWTVH